MKIVLLLFFAKFCSAARILFILPTPIYSHNVVYRSIYTELSNRGHKVTVFTPNPTRNRTNSNLKEVDLSFLYKYVANANFEDFYKMNRVKVVAALQNGLFQLSREIFVHEEMQPILNGTKKFDLLVMEWCSNPAFAVISNVLECPLIGLRALEMRLEGHDSVGNPTTPSYIPTGWADFDVGFWARLNNFTFSVLWRFYYYFLLVPKAQKMAEEFTGYTQDVLEVQQNVSLILTNTHPLITDLRPIVPSIVEIGGVHLRRENETVTKDLQLFMDEATEGIIYINLGSIVKISKLDSETLEMMVSSLKALPYKILWKWANSSYALPQKFKQMDWLPQQTVLGHPNVKLFINHGGLLSMMEAIDNAVPIVAIPFFGDHHINSQKIVKLKIGKRLNIESLSKEEFTETIEGIVQNPKYKENIEKVRSVFHDTPMKPLDKAVWWIEFVLRNGNIASFKSPAIQMSFFTYFSLDIIAFCIFCMFMSIVAFYFTVRFLKKIMVSFKLKQD